MGFFGWRTSGTSPAAAQDGTRRDSSRSSLVKSKAKGPDFVWECYDNETKMFMPADNELALQMEQQFQVSTPSY
jgi:hypothetical protein